MGREVRRVPKNWVHPKNEKGNLQPLYDEDYEKASQEWIECLMSWEMFFDPNRQEHHPERNYHYWEWADNPPDREYYRPNWKEEERTHYQMYETVTEGTPISPVFDSPESLAKWLTENNGDAGAGRTATYEQWLRVCNGGYAPTGILDSKGFRSGVEL